MVASRRDRRELLNKQRALRSTGEQLALLDKRLGNGQGAIRERTRLQTKFAAEGRADIDSTIAVNPIKRVKKGKKASE